VWQAHLHQLSAKQPQDINSRKHTLADLLLNAFNKVFLWDSHAQPIQPLLFPQVKNRNGDINGGAVQRVNTGHKGE